MNRLRFLTMACIAIFLPQVVWALDATSADALASSVLSQLGRTKGVCVVPSCGNGQLARAFLQASSMRVSAIDATATNVDAARTLCNGAGFYQPRFYADKGSLTVMPYADRFVDCIVITNLADADLSGVSYAEIQRVLAPAGMAWVGRATAEGSGITQTALQNWINAATKSRSTATVSTTNGTWAVITGQELHGVDVWVRHSYNATGIKYSKDSVAAFPWLPQMKLKPYRKEGDGTLVTSGGRMYYVSQDKLTSGASTQVLRAYSIYNGELLWSRDVSNDGLGNLNSDPIIAYHEDLYLNKGGSYLRLNGLTGAELGTASSVPADPTVNTPMPTTGEIHGCPPRSASINATYGSTGVYGWDFLDNVQRAGHFYKPPCGKIGTIQSNGFHINTAPTCGCGSGRMTGTHVDATDRTFQFDRDAPTDGSGRLEQGIAFSDLSAQVVPDSLDWTTHRSTVAHEGRTLVSVPVTTAAPPLMWNWVPPHNYITARSTLAYDYLPEQEPTPPVVAKGYTYFGGSDGHVRCIDNSSGRLKWSYATGSRIYATPTVAGGCVYVGSGDGFAYCIEAHTGRLVWRYQAAPVDRRCNLFGHLSSMWPVLSGVLVYNGNAFFVAGMQSEYGSHVYCVNARTGALVWQNNKGATWMNTRDRLGYTPCGYITVARNRLVAANSVAGTVSFNLATGAIDTLPTYGSMGLAVNGYPAIGVSRGREVGVINGTWLVRGAREMFIDHTSRYFVSWWPTPDFVAFEQLDANGVATRPTMALTSVTFVVPAWNNEMYYQCVRNGTSGLRQFSMSAFTAMLTQERSAGGDSWGIARMDPFGGSIDGTSAPSWWPATNWTRDDINVNAIAAAPNGLVALYAKSSATVSIPEAATWYVGVLNKSTGAAVWETALPSVGTNIAGQPVYEGVAVDRNGYIIVTLYNGNVLCYGNGTVSVAQQDVMPPATVASVNLAPSATAHTGVSAGATDRSSDQTPPAAEPVVEQPLGQVRVHGVCQMVPASTTVVREEDYALKAAGDVSDMITMTTGARVHSIPPDVRIQRLKDAGHPADLSWKPQSACLTIASVSASSASSKANSAANTVDRDLRTRWSPATAGEQWLTYDLGTVREVSSASIAWFSTREQVIPFAVMLSVDGKKYHTVDNGTLDGRGARETLRTFLAQDARFVRIALSVSSDKDLPAVQEVGIHGGGTADHAAAE
jgi:outer membrane protein assembly factor BamB